MAVTDLGLSPSEFWDLTWFDWGMYVLKAIKKQEERKSDKEFQMDLTRRFMALYANSKRGKSQKVFLPEDFFKLSYDNKKATEVDPDLFNKVARRLGGTIKAKKGDK